MEDRGFIKQLAGTGCMVFNSRVPGGIEPYKEWYKWLSYIPKHQIDRINILTCKELPTKKEQKELDSYRYERRIFELFKIYNTNHIKQNEYMEVYDFVSKDIVDFMLSKLTDEEIKIAKARLKYFATVPKKELEDKIALEKKIYEDLTYLDAYILHGLILICHSKTIADLNKIANDTYEESRDYKSRCMSYTSNPYRK